MDTDIGVQPNCSELIIRLPGKMTASELFKKLDKVDFENARHVEGGDIDIRSGHGEFEGPIIQGSQHCCKDIYPLMYALSKEFDCPVEPYDGGGIQEYEAWVEAGRPNPKEWDWENG